MDPKIVPVRVMSNLFMNSKKETLPLSEIIYNKNITEVYFYYNFLIKEKKCFFRKTIKIFQRKIFTVRDKKILICPAEDETVLYFSSETEYSRFTNYDRMESYRVNNINVLEGFPKKYEIHFKTENLKGVNWE